MLVPEAVHIRSFGPEYVCVVRTHVADGGVTPKLKVEDYRQRGNKKSVCVCLYLYWESETVLQLSSRGSPIQTQNISTDTHTHTLRELREMTSAQAHHTDLCWGTDRGG